jgi:hypothetical protein
MTESKTLICSASEKQFGIHSGKQMKCKRYFICGCDAGMCEKHNFGNGLPFSPKYVEGKPEKCRKHKGE